MQGISQKPLGSIPKQVILRRDVEEFREHGFVIKPGLLKGELPRRVAEWTDAIARWPEVPGRYMMYFETSLSRPGARLLSRIENFFPYHAGFRELLNGPEMLGAVGGLFGEPAVLFKDKINFKLPGADGFKPHQDVQAGWDAYASLHITAMVTIDVATPENGCLEIAAGHHKRGLVGVRWEPLSVFFDSFTPHRSSPNLSAAPRRVLYITYNRRSEGDHRVQYYADKRKNYPPDCERQPRKQYRFKV
jgi:hypothetical protein